MGRHLEQKHEEQFRKRAHRLGLLLVLLEEWMLSENPNGLLVTEIRMRGYSLSGADVMIVLKGRQEGQPVVGFHSGESPEAALRGVLERLYNNTMKMREDLPWTGGGV